MAKTTHPSAAESAPQSGDPKSPKFDRRWAVRIVVQCVLLLAVFVAGIALVGLAQRVGWLQAAGGDAPREDGAAEGGAVEYMCPMHPEVRQDTPGTCWKCGMELVPTSQEPSEAAASADHAQYICPMMCTAPSSEPGKCPTCGMDLVKADSGGSGAGPRSVSIKPAARRVLGIRTAEARREHVDRTVRTVGEIKYDEERVATIAAYVDGRIEEMFAEYVGVQVARGDDLAVLYSPRLYSAQVEYLSSLQTPALDALGGGDGRLSDVALDNLSELGMTPQQIQALRESGEAQKRLRIASPTGGTVIAKHKVEGDYVQTGEPIYRVADLSTVWLMLNLYPSDAAAVRFGQAVEAEVQSFPGEVYIGRVAFVDPVVSQKTRTVEVRVELGNFDGRLKPGDYATATIRMPAIPREEVYDPALAGKWISPMHPQIIRSQPGECPICGMDLVPTSELGYSETPLPEQEVVTVPRSAVLMAGDNSVAYVETTPGVFEMRNVTIAALTDTKVVVRAGIEAGETVATDGNFLIDSQMQLSGKPSLIDPTRGEGAEAPAPAGEAQHAH